MKIFSKLESSFDWKKKKKKRAHNLFYWNLETSLGLIAHNFSLLLFQVGVSNIFWGEEKTPSS